LRSQHEGGFYRQDTKVAEEKAEKAMKKSHSLLLSSFSSAALAPWR